MHAAPSQTTRLLVDLLLQDGRSEEAQRIAMADQALLTVEREHALNV